jgi:hypothetical protein
VRLISKTCLKAFTGSGVGDSIICYRDSGRGRKTFQEEKTRSERYPKKINLREIKPVSENSEEDLKERYLNEIDPRRSFSGY